MMKSCGSGNGWGVRTRRMVAAGALAAALVGGAAALGRAVSVSPMSVFIDHRARTGTITLYNPNPLPEEIDIGFAFGYPQSDSAGDVTVPLAEEPAPAGEPSAVPWLRAFPRRLVLQPGQQQVVRILAQPPADLADGEYWSRVLITATGGRPPVEQQIEDVRVAINMRTIIVASLNYRKGRVTTGIVVDSARATAGADSVQLVLDLTRSGAAAYLGRIRVELLAADGRVLVQEEDIVSVYRSLRRRFMLPAMNGAARVRYTLETERPELGQANIIQAPPVSGAVDLR